MFGEFFNKMDNILLILGKFVIFAPLLKGSVPFGAMGSGKTGLSNTF